MKTLRVKYEACAYRLYLDELELAKFSKYGPKKGLDVARIIERALADFKIKVDVVYDLTELAMRRNYKNKGQKRGKKKTKVRASKTSYGENPGDRRHRRAKALNLQRERVKNLDYMPGLSSPIRDLPGATYFEVR